jgi:hypothetical protein
MYLKLILVIVFQLISENDSNLLPITPNFPTIIPLTNSPPTIQKPSINLNLFQIEFKSN